MTSIRNLPLAARLGGAFGVLCVAVAIVAFTGMHAMTGLRAETDELGERHLAAAQLLGGMQERAKDNVGLIAQHLYVRDGDLAAQDEIVEGDRGQLGREQGRRRQAREAVRGHHRRGRVRGVVADPRRRCSSCRSRCSSASRAETVANAEERTGSRTAFEQQLLKLDAELETDGRGAAAATNEFAAEGMKAAHAADAPAPASS